MRHIGIVFMVAALLAVALVAGCMSAPEEKANATEVKSATVTESSSAQESSAVENNTTRFVELQALDGSRVGGQYVSESEAFVTIIPLYVEDKYGTFSRGNGKATGIKTSMISTMIDIPDPTSLIDGVIEKQNTERAQKQKEMDAANAKIAEENSAKLHA